MKTLHNNKGFTLIEIMAVLIIMGIVAVLVVPKMINFTDSTNEVVIQSTISTLNDTEKMTWINVKLEGYKNDNSVFSVIEYPINFLTLTPNNGSININDEKVDLVREISTKNEPAKWETK